MSNENKSVKALPAWEVVVVFFGVIVASAVMALVAHHLRVEKQRSCWPMRRHRHGR